MDVGKVVFMFMSLWFVESIMVVIKRKVWCGILKFRREVRLGNKYLVVVGGYVVFIIWGYKKVFETWV